MKAIAATLCALLFSVLLAGAYADTCLASVTLTPRAGNSYPSGSGVSQIYDLNVRNAGNCILNNIVLAINLPAGAFIQSSWNIQQGSGNQWTLTNYGGALQANSLANAGFIVNFPNTNTVPSGVSASIALQQCNQCSTSSTSTSSSTSSSTTSTSSTTGSNPLCTSSAALTPRQGGSYPTGSGVSQIYDVVVTNTGSCAVNNIILSISLPQGASITSSWNLQAGSGNQYTVTSYQGTLPIGNSVNVGFIVYFPNTQSVPSGVSTSIQQTSCNSCTSSSTGSSSTSSSTSTSTSTGAPNPRCTTSVQVVARSNSSWQTSNGVSQIYDLFVTNTGTCAVNNIVLTLNLPSNAAITSSWNLQALSGNQYTVTSYQGTLPIGNQVNAGFVANFASTQTVPSSGISASSASTCNVC